MKLCDPSAVTDRKRGLRRTFEIIKKTPRQLRLPAMVGLVVIWPSILARLTGESVESLTIPYKVIAKIAGAGDPETLKFLAYLISVPVSIAIAIRLGYLAVKALVATALAVFQAMALTIAAISAFVKEDIDREIGIPFFAHFILISLGRNHYNEILADITDCFPAWESKFGRRRATLLCYTWIGSCLRVRLMQNLDSLLTLRRRSAR